MGHVVDLGTTGSRARIARARGGTRRSSLGHRRVADTATPVVPVVVIGGVRVIQESWRGYGRTGLTGLAKTETPDVIVFLDGDCSAGPSELPLMLTLIIDRVPDIAVGALRRKKQPRCATVARIVRQSLGRWPDQAFAGRERQ